MNRFHRWYCQSRPWRCKLDQTILPWALSGIELGDELLEVGPGPGLTTDWLRLRSKQVTCVEIDFVLARSLSRRMAGTNVIVRHADATAMPFPDTVFSSAVCFTALPCTFPILAGSAVYRSVSGSQARWHLRRNR